MLFWFCAFFKPFYVQIMGCCLILSSKPPFPLTNSVTGSLWESSPGFGHKTE